MFNNTLYRVPVIIQKKDGEEVSKLNYAFFTTSPHSAVELAVKRAKRNYDTLTHNIIIAANEIKVG